MTHQLIRRRRSRSVAVRHQVRLIVRIMLSRLYPLSLLAPLIAAGACKSRHLTSEDKPGPQTARALLKTGDVPSAATGGTAANSTVPSISSNNSSEAETRQVKWQQPHVLALGAADRGPWRMNESRFHYVDDPNVAFDSGGGLGVVWVDNKLQTVFFQSYDADGTPRLTEPSSVSRSPQIFSWLPRVLFSSDDAQVYVLWQEIVFSGGSHGGEIFFARSTNRGKHFEKPLNLSNTVAGAGKGRLTEKHWHNGSLDLALDSRGTVFAAWTEYEGPLRFARSTDGGQSFSSPVRVGGTQEHPARGPSLTVSREGTIYLAWTVGEDPEADIRFTRSTDRGQSFHDDQLVFDSEGHSDAPSLTITGDGTVHLVYAESPTGLFQRSHINYTQLGDDGKFLSPRPISPVRNESTEHDTGAAFPTLEAGGTGHLYVVWEHYARSQERPSGLGFSFSLDQGKTFAPGSMLPAPDVPSERAMNGGLQGLLSNKLAATANASLAVVNSRFVPGDRSYVYLLRGRLQ